MEILTNWWFYGIGLGSILVIVITILIKQQDKYVKSLSVGDIVSYNGKLSKIKKLNTDKSKVTIETVVSSREICGKHQLSDFEKLNDSPTTK